MLDKSLAFLRNHPAVPYLIGGADATGMDCSGAVAFLLKQAGIQSPRSAADQFAWLGRQGTLTLVPATARDPRDPVFRGLQPADLVFWATDNAEAATKPHVTHVHMFLGREKDGHAVMIGASEGRSYRGKKLVGFGIVDFHVPKTGSATRIVGYGSPLPVCSSRPRSVPTEPPSCRVP